MVNCSSCSNPLTGRAPDVYICVDNGDGTNIIFGYCCWKPRYAPKPRYGKPYRGSGPGVTVEWLTPEIIKTGDK